MFTLCLLRNIERKTKENPLNLEMHLNITMKVGRTKRKYFKLYRLRRSQIYAQMQNYARILPNLPKAVY